jgi:hypothetical protein
MREREAGTQIEQYLGLLRVFIQKQAKSFIFSVYSTSQPKNFKTSGAWTKKYRFYFKGIQKNIHLLT